MPRSFPFMCAYLLVVKKRVRKYGEDDMLAKRKQSRTVMDTFGGYMELEVNNAFPISQTAFLKGLDRISSNRMKLDTILGLPLFLSELSVIIGLGLLVAFGEGDVKMVVWSFCHCSISSASRPPYLVDGMDADTEHSILLEHDRGRTVKTGRGGQYVF